MFINKAKSGANNICGERIAKYRTEMRLSQRGLADKLQILGLDIDKNAIQRIESGKRFITDIELVFLSTALEKPITELIDQDLLTIHQIPKEE